MKSTISLITVITFLSIALPAPVEGLALRFGQNQIPVRYSEVIDRVFQFSEGIPAELRGIEARIVIRYLPGPSRPESQVVLLKGNDGTVRVIHYNLKHGTRPIIDQYNQALEQKPSTTAEEILERVSVERVERKGEESIVRLVRELFSISISTKFNSDVCTDGMTYELWVQTPSNEIHASLSDCAYGKNTDSAPIIRWIRAIGAELHERK